MIDRNNPEPYENLANAIVLQAVDDYRKALRKNDRREKKKLEYFFLHELDAFTNLDGQMLIDKLKKERKHEQAISKKNNKRVTK